jgi:hypothetical protein
MKDIKTGWTKLIIIILSLEILMKLMRNLIMIKGPSFGRQWKIEVFKIRFIIFILFHNKE